MSVGFGGGLWSLSVSVLVEFKKGKCSPLRLVDTSIMGGADPELLFSYLQRFNNLWPILNYTSW